MAQRIVNLKDLERQADRLAAEVEVAAALNDRAALATAQANLELLQGAVEQARDAAAVGKREIQVTLPKAGALSDDLSLDDDPPERPLPAPKVKDALEIEEREL